MRWVSLGSIGLIAFMGCTGPVAAQQTQSRPKPRRAATSALLLASAALATGIFAGAMVNPQTAQALCAGDGLEGTDQQTYAWLRFTPTPGGTPGGGTPAPEAPAIIIGQAEA